MRRPLHHRQRRRSRPPLIWELMDLSQRLSLVSQVFVKERRGQLRLVGLRAPQLGMSQTSEDIAITTTAPCRPGLLSGFTMS
jgi:hypothetical protein